MDLLGWMKSWPAPSAPVVQGGGAHLASAALLRLARLAVNPTVAIADLLRAVTEELSHGLGIPVDIYGWTPDREGLVLRASCGWSTAGIAMARVERAGSLVFDLASGPQRAFTLPAPSPPPMRVVEEGILAGVAAPIRAHALGWGVVVAWSPAPLAEDAARLVGDVATLMGDTVAARFGGALPAAGNGDGVLVIDADDRVRLVCPAAEVLLGLPASSALGQPIDDVRELAPLVPAIRAGRSEGAVAIAGHWLEPSFRRVLGPKGGSALQIVLRDVSRRQRAEQEVAALRTELAQARRLEAIGALAGGVAHDFNNLLTVILTTGGLVLRDEPLTDQARTDVEQMVQAAHRGAALVRQLLAFTPEQPEERSTVSMGKVVERLRQMLDLLMDGGANLEVDVEPGDTSVHADMGQLEQVVVNLVLNARDALSGSGRIGVRVDRVVQSFGAGEPTTAWVRLTVQDDGLGMTEAVRERIFEPFFTTKGPDAGTGLGLPTVQRIVQACGGRIEVASEPGRGSRFTVWIPASRGAQARAPVSTPPMVMLRPPGEGVLLVEADDAVRAETGRLLQAVGFGVIEARSSEEALRAWRREAIPVDLLMIGTVGLEPEDGLELLACLREVRPLLPAVLILDEQAVRPPEHLVPGELRVLRRPYGPRELVTVLQGVMEADGTLDQPPAQRVELQRTPTG